MKQKFLKSCLLFLSVILGLLFFRFVITIPPLFGLLSFVLLLAYYYYVFWVNCKSPSFKLRGKIYKSAYFALSCYWGLLLFDIYTQRITKLSAMDYYEDYEEIWYTRTYGIPGIIDDILTSAGLSILFIIIVYLYWRFISSREHE